MRISDWSSDVCSADLFAVVRSVSCRVAFEKHSFPMPDVRPCLCSVGICMIESADLVPPDFLARTPVALSRADEHRTRGVEGQSVSARVDLGGRRILRKTKNEARTGVVCIYITR